MTLYVYTETALRKIIWNKKDMRVRSIRHVTSLIGAMSILMCKTPEKKKARYRFLSRERLPEIISSSRGSRLATLSLCHKL